VGARAADPSNKLNAGKSYVVFGKKDNTMPAAMSDKLIAVLSFLPNTTYDLPGLNLLS
jgi:hypothetical protein